MHLIPFYLFILIMMPKTFGLELNNLQWITQIVSYVEPIPEDVSNSCRGQVEQFILDLRNTSIWALKMMDANGRYPSGTLSGNIRSVGRFDQCLRARHPLDSYTAKYCLVRLNFTLEEQLAGQNEWNELLEETTNHRRLHEQGYDWFKGDFLLPMMSHGEVGICLPAGCSTDDVRTIAQVAIDRATLGTGIYSAVSLYDEYCFDSLRNNPSYSQTDFIVAIFFALTLIVIAAATFYTPNIQEKESKYFAVKVFESFSIRTNWKKFASVSHSSPDDISCLDGLRSISTVWVVLTHEFLLYSQTYFINKTEHVKTHDNYLYYVVWNGLVNVDTFFFISGLLTSYNIIKKLKNDTYSPLKQGLQRYLRLTPVYFYVILFYATFFYRMDSGPKWNYYVQRHSDACMNNWWSNLLYINNYYPEFDKMCVIQSWYLAADMQLFLLAPLMIYPLYKWKLVGKVITFVAMAGSVAFTFFTTIVNKYPPTFVYNADNNILNAFAENVYLRTHTRMSPYLLGIFMGFVLRSYNNSKSSNLTKPQLTIGWTMCLVFVYTCIWGAMGLTSPTASYTLLEAASYSGFHHIAWAAAIAWVVYTCHTGNCDTLNKILSATIFKYMTKLSYCVYLTHMGLLLFNAGVLQVPLQVHMFLNIRDFCGDFVFVYVASVVLYICLELPFCNITKLIFQDQRR